jgi:hypothetical protein
VRGWDGPASPLAPRTRGSAGGVQAGQGLVPTLPPQLQHFYLVAEPRHKVRVDRRGRGWVGLGLGFGGHSSSQTNQSKRGKGWPGMRGCAECCETGAGHDVLCWWAGCSVAHT